MYCLISVRTSISQNEYENAFEMAKLNFEEQIADQEFSRVLAEKAQEHGEIQDSQLHVDADNNGVGGVVCDTKD